MKNPIALLVAFQIRHPWWPIAIAAAITILLGFRASKLELRTQYDALLPPGQTSVQELRRLEKRTTSSQTVLVLLEGDVPETLHRMGDHVVEGLMDVPPSIVSNAADGPHDARRYLLPRAGFFLSRETLGQLNAEVDARLDYEVAKATGLLLENDKPPPPLSAESLTSRLSSASRTFVDRFPRGYYEQADGKALVVVARSPIAGGDLPRAQAALADIRRVVANVQASSADFQGLRVSFAGDLPTGLMEYGVLYSDLLGVGALGLGLILAAVLFYFMRVRAVLVMAITILVGLIWTFGLTQMVIGHLNVATAFLISIVAGNGINVGILYQSRYFEERNRGLSAEDALRRSVHETWLPTAVAAFASAASYGSLMATDFRAFRDFGFIAASGMILCWVVKTLLVPPLLLLMDRVSHEAPASERRFGRWEMAYGRPFTWLVGRLPRFYVVLGCLIAGLGTIAGVTFVLGDPMEHDMRNVENDRSATAELHRTWDVCNQILGASQGAMVVAADTAADARELAAKLRARWDAAPTDAKPFVSVGSLNDFIPPDQEAKLPMLASLGERLRHARARGYIDVSTWEKIAPMVPPKGLVPFTMADLPESIAAPFTEKNGTRGTLVFVEAAPTTSNDVRDLVRYADSYRETRLGSGKVVYGTGSAVIFADMLKGVARDVPRATALAMGLTLLAVFMTLRGGSPRYAVLFALWAGFAGVALFLFLSGARLSFLNFAALPVTFGVGADYAVNIGLRYKADGSKDALSVLRTSGGAVVLCSLTTMLGYVALLGSHNQAIRSLGSIAAVGEVCCVLAAVIILPSLWLAGDQKQSVHVGTSSVTGKAPSALEA